MKERPILFSAPMVRSLLDGSKTQTRRAGKNQCRDWSGLNVEYSKHATQGLQAVATFDAFPGVGTARHGICACPHGVPGDRLWVRETWYCDDYRVQSGPYLLPADQSAEGMREDGTLVYCADDTAPYEQDQPVWRPSIHMPRWASRITLEITGVRVERLQGISEADAMAEGVDMLKEITIPLSAAMPFCTVTIKPRSAVEAYAVLWESINGPGSWAANPWVWVIEFKVVKK